MEKFDKTTTVCYYGLMNLAERTKGLRSSVHQKVEQAKKSDILSSLNPSLVLTGISSAFLIPDLSTTAGKIEAGVGAVITGVAAIAGARRQVVSGRVHEVQRLLRDLPTNYSGSSEDYLQQYGESYNTRLLGLKARIEEKKKSLEEKNTSNQRWQEERNGNYSNFSFYDESSSRRNRKPNKKTTRSKTHRVLSARELADQKRKIEKKVLRDAVRSKKKYKLLIKKPQQNIDVQEQHDYQN